MTSCHVSLKPNRGPVSAQTTITPAASANVPGRPVARAVHFAKRVNHDLDFEGLISCSLRFLVAEDAGREARGARVGAEGDPALARGAAGEEGDGELAALRLAAAGAAF